MTADCASSGILLQDHGQTLLLDCGMGVVREVMRAGVNIHDITAVLISHIHPDHVMDLATLAVLRTQRGPLPAIFGAPGIAGYMQGVLALTHAQQDIFAHPPPPERYATPIVEITGSDDRTVAGFRVRSEETPHSPEVTAAVRRLDAGRSAVIYSGDTIANPDVLVPLATGAAVLLHEAFSEEGLVRFVSSLEPGAAQRTYYHYRSTHTEVEAAARIAAAAGVQTLALTHLLPTERPETLERLARQYFTGEVLVAKDGLSINC